MKVRMKVLRVLALAVLGLSLTARAAEMPRSLECYDEIGSKITIDLGNTWEGDAFAPYRRAVFAQFSVTGPAAERFGDFELLEKASVFRGVVSLGDASHFTWQPTTARSSYSFELFITDQKKLIVMGDSQIWEFNRGCLVN